MTITRPSGTGSRTLGLTVGWGTCFAIGAALMTWSGRYYVAMPLWFVLVAGAGLLGGAIGRWLVLSGLLRTEASICAALAAPVILGYLLVSLAAPGSGPFGAGMWEEAKAYRGGCLIGTEFIEPEARISLDNGTIILHSAESDRKLRFVSTEKPWPSLARAEFNNRGATPADRATIDTLASIGCE